MFYANAVNSSPSEFSLIMPPDTSGMPLNTLQPTFYWSSSTDPDPFDSILYTLLIAVDSNFNFFNEVDSINNTELVLPFELDRVDRYWWKVKAEDQYGGLTWPTNILNFWTMMCGDGGNDQTINVSDAVYIINFVFIGGLDPIPYEPGMPTVMVWSMSQMRCGLSTLSSLVAMSLVIPMGTGNRIAEYRKQVP
jgi:hypothetical protein